ncbi:hypothetical protein LG651_08760 [Tamlana sp. 62-3]|uniref:Metalloprotease n=2 Tax=Neotamlana sargassicola TaxID=2883125 RepID=A0A9X1L712_9FLAO|nr:hypothetical protein [Tamlana sargassicola]
MKYLTIVTLTIITLVYAINKNHMLKDKIIPVSIKQEVETALKYYPELKDTHIEFKFKKNIKKSTMQAQPKLSSFFKTKEHRDYVILISETFKISDKKFLTKNIPSDILIGWIGHELGHIKDYQNRSTLNLIGFGVKYLFSDNHIVEAERAADTYAVKHGMAKYIIKTKNFILNNADITTAYKNRIKKYYLSPEEIMEIVETN